MRLAILIVAALLAAPALASDKKPEAKKAASAKPIEINCIATVWSDVTQKPLCGPQYTSQIVPATVVLKDKTGRDVAITIQLPVCCQEGEKK